jgi:TetR/AcrR family transcriptional regulator, transcriptional repressor for nem operon
VRVSKQKAAQNRRRILAAASRLFRKNGVDACGIDAITREAGLTHGAFYSHFESKDAAVTEAIRLALETSREALRSTARGGTRKRRFASVVDAYLGAGHRDSRGKGCVIAALGPDIARQPKRVRAAFTVGLKQSLALLADLAPGRDAERRYDDAIAALSCMAGALILARAVDEEAFSRRILLTAARRLNRAESFRARPGPS